MAVEVTGYVLAGGRSSRMGQEKALLELGGRTLLARSVGKLSAVCGDTYILGANPAFSEYAPIVPDLHPGCGPIGGLEAALTHCRTEWALILPVDLPFLPVALLRAWIEAALASGNTRLAIFTVDGLPQPTLVLLHREVLPYLSGAVEQGRFKLFPVLLEAAKALATEQGVAEEAVLENSTVTDEAGWFANVNTPEEFAAAQIMASSERE